MSAIGARSVYLLMLVVYQILSNTGGGCMERCKDNDPLCTAATDPFLDLEDYYADSIFSQDPQKNPAFHGYNIGEGKVDQE